MLRLCCKFQVDLPASTQVTKKQTLRNYLQTICLFSDTAKAGGFTFWVSTDYMAKAEKSNQFIAIRSMFVTGSVRRLRDIEKLYPTAMAKALGINHSRYIHKLYHPEEFSIKHLLLMARTLELDVQMLIDVVLKQSNSAQKVPKRS